MDMQNFIQSITALSDTGFMAITLYLSVMTAFFIVAYSVGAKLHRSQLIIISVLATIFAFIFAVATWVYLSLVVNMTIEQIGYVHWVSYFPDIILFAELAGIVAALKFMIDIRKEHNNLRSRDDDT